MLRYLRGVRKQLFAKNKYSQYVQYAVVEIGLVVIGILIALTINNLNDKKLENDRADRFLDRLKVQLENNMETVDWHIETNELYYGYSEGFLSIIGEEKEQYDDAQLDSLVMFNVFDFNLNLDMNPLLEGRENGDFALLSSDDLTQAIYRLVKSYDEIIERERITNADLNDRFIPYLNKHYNFTNLLYRMSEDPNAVASKVYKGDNYKVLFDQEFENLIMQRQSLGTDLLELYIYLKEDMLLIHEAIK